MINSSVSYQAGVARINDLRLAADKQRHVNLASCQSAHSRSVSARSVRAQLTRTLAALRPRRAARA